MTAGDPALKGKKGAVVPDRHRDVADKIGLEVGNVMRGPTGIDDKVESPRGAPP